MEWPSACSLYRGILYEQISYFIGNPNTLWKATPQTTHKMSNGNTGIANSIRTVHSNYCVQPVIADCTKTLEWCDTNVDTFAFILNENLDKNWVPVSIF